MTSRQIFLSDSEFNLVDSEIAIARGLPNRAYTDATWADLERDRVFYATWMCIGFVDDVAPRHAVPVDVLGQPLVMVRDADGTVRVFHNVCRHRGHRLVAAPGPLKAAIRCPYHSWSYGLDGALKATPHIGGAGIHEIDGFDKTSHGLIAVKAAEWLGMVFVNLSGTAGAFESHIAPLRRRWEQFADADALGHLHAAADGGLELEVNANWKFAVENYCESYHLPWVHPDLNRYSRIEDHYPIMEDGIGAGQGTTVFDYSGTAGINLPQLPMWPEPKKAVAEYIALYPNVLLGLQVDHLFAVLLTPLAPNRTRETMRLFFVDDAAMENEHASARRSVREGWKQVFGEDVAVVEGMQQGRASDAFDGGAFSPAMDQASLHFHRWIAERMRAVA